MLCSSYPYRNTKSRIHEGVLIHLRFQRQGSYQPTHYGDLTITLSRRGIITVNKQWAVMLNQHFCLLRGLVGQFFMDMLSGKVRCQNVLFLVCKAIMLAFALSMKHIFSYILLVERYSPFLYINWSTQNTPFLGIQFLSFICKDAII